jgi:nucleolar pre-ribosomal-associated protein 2
LGHELENGVYKKMLLDVFWIASASIPENRFFSIDWLLQNSEAFPDLWMSILHSEIVLNNKLLLGE